VETCDVAIIGGGIIGSSIAFELASGKLRVLVLDQQQPGREASWAAAGMLSASPDSPEAMPLVALAKESLRLYPGFVTEVEESSGRSVDYAREGALQIYHASHDEDERGRFIEQHRLHSLAAEPVSVESAHHMEPALGAATRAAVWLPDEATVDPRSLSEAVLAGAARRGAEIRSGCAVSSLLRDGNRCSGVVAGGEKIAARHVVLAAGAFSRNLAPAAARNQGNKIRTESQDEFMARYAPTHPVRGQMIALRSTSVRLKRVLRSDRGYLVPRRDGRVVAGSTLEDAGFEKRVTAAGLHQILAAALELVPALAGAEVVETWSGLRPGTPDNLPIIGPISGPADVEGLLIATGHYRNGILLAPVTAKLIAEWILHGSVAAERAAQLGLENFSPLRFTAMKKAVLHASGAHTS
jgi:glycine oxidase